MLALSHCRPDRHHRRTLAQHRRAAARPDREPPSASLAGRCAHAYVRRDVDARPGRVPRWRNWILSPRFCKELSLRMMGELLSLLASTTRRVASSGRTIYPDEQRTNPKPRGVAFPMLRRGSQCRWRTCLRSLQLLGFAGVSLACSIIQAKLKRAIQSLLARR